LIQADSGGGKSWLLRLSPSARAFQTIVLDKEGEFVSLREAVDVLLIGRERRTASQSANPFLRA
jgi:hypothetical protein